MRPNRTLIMTIAPAVMGAALSLSGQAPDWRGRPVTVIVPLAAGGNTDMMARLAAQHLTNKFGHTFIVENRPSAGGAIATAQVGAAPPDGYTLLFTPSSMLLLTPLLQKLSFDPDRQLVPVTNVGTGAQVIAIKRELPAHTLPEFLAYAKANPLAAGTAQRTPDEARNRALLTNLAPSRPISRTSRLIRQRQISPLPRSPTQCQCASRVNRTGGPHASITSRE